MITIIVAILAGLVLLAGSLHSIPGVGARLARFARLLAPFEVVIGVVAIVVGLLELLSLEGILLILAGLVLAVSALRSIPSIGPTLGRWGNALAKFRVIIGVIILLIAVFDLVQFLFGSLGRGR